VSSWRSAWRALLEFWAVQVELHERLALLNRPWEQDVLHWADGELHGSVAPPEDGRRRGVTADGWCPCPRHDRADGMRRGVGPEA
jgi:hypothetical protein